MSGGLSPMRSGRAWRMIAPYSSPFLPVRPPGAPTSIFLAVEYDETVEPMPQKPSISDATDVADSRSPETPDELSPLKNIRSPARDASDTRMSDSYSVRHRVT